MTVISNGVNLWATGANQRLHNDYNSTNDTFHAAFDDTFMNGGGGADTFRIKAGTHWSVIQHFRFGEGDVVKIDGIKTLDPNLITVRQSMVGDFDVTYGSEGDPFYTRFQFMEPLDKDGNRLELNADEFKALLTNTDTKKNYVQLGGSDAKADYFIAFESVELAKLATAANKQTFEITGERTLYVDGFAASKNRNNLVFNLPDTSVPLYVGYDLVNTVQIRQGDKLLAQLTIPEGTKSLDNWWKSTLSEIRGAAKEAGLTIKNR